MLHIYIGYPPSPNHIIDLNRPERYRLRVDHAAMADDWMACVHARSDRLRMSVYTDAETALLRIRRRIVEGSFPLDLLRVTFTSLEGEEIEIGVTPEGDVTTWPEGWFSEDFQEVKALARARRARGMST